MDWLFGNPLGNMWGPTFLVFYALFSALVILCAHLYVTRSDAADVLDLPETPMQFDPYEIAYLRGDVNEVIRTAVYALKQKGLIEIERRTFRTARIRPSGGTPNDLTDIERRVMDAIRAEPAVPQLFSNADLRETLKILCEPYRGRLNDQGLLPSDAAQRARKTAVWTGATLLIALALYKLAAASVHGRSNVGLLCVFAFIACIVLFATIGRHKPMSRRGKAYLERLQLAYGGPRLTALAAPTGTDAAMRAAALGMVGLFGLNILKGTPDAALAQTFAQSSGSDGGGGGCGGGGGGGGCGGCGGGD